MIGNMRANRFSTVSKVLAPGAVRLQPVVAVSRRTAMSKSKVDALAGLDKLYQALGKSAAADKSVVEDQSHQKGHSASPLDPNNKMWCYQCEQTLNKEGCHSVGMCGKTPEVAGLQDLMIYQMKGLGSLSHHARQHGVEDQEINVFINSTIFTTLTNVNFDDERMADFIREGDRLMNKLRATLQSKGVPQPEVPHVPQLWGSMPHPLEWSLSQVTGRAHPTAADLLEVSRKTTISARVASLGETLCGLQELMAYGLKGLCAYAHHAEALGFRDTAVYADVARHLAFLSGPDSLDVGNTLAGCLGVGATNFRVMQLLDEAHTTTFGHPSPHKVSLFPEPGKSILITGHDMHDLKLLLDQTEGTGIKVYTHGEMLPGHSYPGLRKYAHLAGHYGGAWYRQKSDFAHFPGSVLVTTNCVLDPLTSYRNNIFTTNETGLSGIHHIADKDFSVVIKRAQELPGFTAEDVAAFPHKEVSVGYAHNTVLGASGEVVKAIQDNRLQHIFLIGGCDGNEPQRKYYSQLFKYMPEETLILTMGCGKFRIFDQDFGNIPGTQLPRLMDMGQCNDAYSALVVATELAKVFKTDVNNLPLSLDLSWFEQKAVAVLLTLLNLGVRNIRLGPRLPAFLTPEAVKVLVDKFNLMPADEAHPESDVKAMLVNQ